MDDNMIIVHFFTEGARIYAVRDGHPQFIEYNQVFFNETLVNNELFRKIDRFLIELKNTFGDRSNKNTRLYATGVFQDFSIEEQTQIVIHIFVQTGLFFNIVKPDLEKFYLENCLSAKVKPDMIEGLAVCEFRRVVVCGSFQQNLNEISEIMDSLEKKSIKVLSPWTKEVVPETLGTNFILLKGQELENARDSWRHKYDHMNKFVKADAVIVCNPDGIIGKGTMFEFGFMVAHSKRVIFTNEPKELSIVFPYEIGVNFI